MTCEDEELSYQSQQLVSVPSHVFKPCISSRLRSLDLSRNLLCTLPSAIGGLQSLECLNLSRNKLRILPPELGRLMCLVELNVLSNSLRPHIRSLPLPELAALPLLRILDLRFNDKLKSVAYEALSNILSSNVDIRVTTTKTTNAHNNIEHACDRDATLLKSQLEPLSTPTLHTRLERDFGVEPLNPDTTREVVMARLLDAYGGRPREPISFQGVPVAASLIEQLLDELRAWTQEQKAANLTRERPKIRAECYMILRSPVEFSKSDSVKAKRAALKLEKHMKLWELAHSAVRQVDEEFAQQFTALAVTFNFVGSPHIDTQNTGPFYGMALGEFSEGGELCVEWSARQVAQVDTRDRLAKVDGRFVHWVAPYQGERYSLIFYRTLGDPTLKTTAVLSTT